MSCRIMDLQAKEVICICNGVCLGRVCDVEVDTCTGKLCSLIIFGKLRCFGILGRDDDFVISWNEIEVIGEDTILVSCDPPKEKARRGKKFLKKLFG